MESELLQILVCPQCKKSVEHQPEEKKLICHHCKLAYSIKNDIPVMLLEEAEKLS